VAAATLRAWERRYGVGPSARTSGGHRRYSATDIAALQHLQRLTLAGIPTAAAAALAVQTAGAARVPTADGTSADGAMGTGSGHGRAARRFGAAIDALDPAGLARASDAVLADQGAVRAWTDVFAPHLQALGRRWESTGHGVEREHVTVFAVQDAFARHVRKQGRRRSGTRVLLAAVPDERHTLPLDALTAALAESGFRTYAVGSLPEIALHTAIEDTAATVVALWARSAQTADTPLLRSLLNRAPAVFAAGPGWRPSRLPRAVSHLSSLSAALDSILAWST
jgi:hypothetical protein